MAFVLCVLAGIIVLPMIFPSVFWKKADLTNDDVNIIVFNLEKQSENPYLVEHPTVITFYDTQQQLMFATSVTSDPDKSSDDIHEIIENIMSKHPHNYFVTYDDVGSKEAFVRTIVKNPNVINLKQLFYLTHTHVPKITCSEMLEYYNLPKTSSKILDYTYIFENIARDYDIHIFDNMSEIVGLYKKLISVP
jgi:hypothetical protein